MEETTTSKQAGKGLGIAGLVLGILAAVFSFIPCLGMYAFFPGVVGLVLSIVSIMQASKANAPKGMAIAGLVCSLLGCAIAGWQYSKIASGLENMKENLEQMDTAKLRMDMEKVMQDLADSTKAH